LIALINCRQVKDEGDVMRKMFLALFGLAISIPALGKAVKPIQALPANVIGANYIYG
jgi:hypothetical protein